MENGPTKVLPVPAQRRYINQFPLSSAQQLGEWVAPPNQTWSHYIDPKKDLLYHIQTPTNIASHMRSTSAKKHHRHYHTFSCEVEQISTPASEITQLVPAELISLRPEDRTQNLYVLLGTKKSTNKTRTHWHYFHSYKKSLPPEGHRLLAWSSLRPPYNNKDITTIISSLTHTAILECGSDGSLSNRKGTCGYALSIDGKIFWHGAGPADGDTTTANSKRPELYGYAGCLEACLMILKVSKDSIRAPITEMTVRIWVDNASAHRHLNGLLTTRTQRTRYPNDPDILSHIQ